MNLRNPVANKITLVTGYTPDYANIGIISDANKRAYCLKHGYNFVTANNFTHSPRPASWSKIPLILKHLPHADWVFWSDADSLIMNDNIKLETMIDNDVAIIFNEDCNWINCGQFFVRNCIWSRIFLGRVWLQKEFINYPWWEQSAVHHLVKTEAPKEIKIVSQQFFNSYPNNYKPGDFLLHFAGQGSQRLELMRKYCP